MKIEQPPVPGQEKLEKKFSPAGEFKKLEQERLASGEMAVYPELWGPIEKKGKNQF